MTAIDPTARPDPRRPGRPPRPDAQIVRVAVELVDQEGADALTLRSLASRLGSSTATVYRHFDGRASIVDAVVDAVFTEVDLDADESGLQRWDTVLTSMAMSLFGALKRHPNVAPLMLERIRTSETVGNIREEVLALLLAHGFPPRHALQIYTTVGRYVLGFGVQTRIDGRAVFEDADRAVQTRSAAPATAIAASAGPITLDEEFAFGLAMLMLAVRTAHDDTTPPDEPPRADPEPPTRN